MEDGGWRGGDCLSWVVGEGVVKSVVKGGGCVDMWGFGGNGIPRASLLVSPLFLPLTTDYSEAWIQGPWCRVQLGTNSYKR